VTRPVQDRRPPQRSWDAPAPDRLGRSALSAILVCVARRREIWCWGSPNVSALGWNRWCRREVGCVS